jgi:hypothetical protein
MARIVQHNPVVVEDRSVATGPAGSRVEQIVDGPVVSERHVVTHRRFDPAAVFTVIGGLALAVVGAVAVARAGLDGPIDDPVVQVAGVSHTALLGLIEIGVGLLTVLAGLSRDRGTILFATIAFGVAALVAAIEPSVGGGALAIERSWAIVLVVGFGFLALVAALAPTMIRSTDRIDRV